MGIGSFRKRVVFQSQNQTADGGGGFTTTWSNRITVWGQFTPERGRERIEAGRLEASVAGILDIRSSTETQAVTEEYRVQIDDVPYQIRSITNKDQRNQFLEIVVERGTAQ